MSKKNSSTHVWEDYVVIDLETTGLSPQRDEVMEIGAVKVQKGKVEATFQALVKINGKIPPSVSQLTGLTDEMLQTKGRLLQEVLTDFLSFVGELPVVAHNGDFDYAFLRTACANHGLPLFSNRRTDTLTLAKRWIEQIPDYKLETLVEHLSIPVNRLHRSLEDCFATMQLYEKLNEIRQNRL